MRAPDPDLDVWISDGPPHRFSAAASLTAAIVMAAWGAAIVLGPLFWIWSIVR